MFILERFYYLNEKDTKDFQALRQAWKTFEATPLRYIWALLQ